MLFGLLTFGSLFILIISNSTVHEVQPFFMVKQRALLDMICNNSSLHIHIILMIIDYLLIVLTFAVYELQDMFTRDLFSWILTKFLHSVGIDYPNLSYNFILTIFHLSFPS